MDQPRTKRLSLLARLLQLPEERLFLGLRSLGALLILGAALFLGFGRSPIADRLQRSSYDWLYKLSFLRLPDIRTNDVVIVYVDELSQTELHQPRNAPWDRSLYAELLDRSTREGARAVVLDVIFSGPSDPESDARFERALRENGRTVIGVDMVALSSRLGDNEDTQFTSLVFPEEQFGSAAAALGLVQMRADEDFIVRRHYHESLEDPSLAGLAWRAAEVADLRTDQLGRRDAERYVRYYGGPETIPHVSFYQAIRGDAFPAPGFFKDKIVFVGARPTASLLVERRDEFRSSLASWNKRFLFMPAVEVHATIFLNLLRQDWLVRLPRPLEGALLLAVSFSLAFGLARFRPGQATLVACVSGALFTIAALLVFAGLGAWFAWLAVILVQLPLAMLLAMLCSSLEWLLQRRRHERERAAAARKLFEQAALLDKAQDAIIVHDLSGEVTFWNQGAERIYGWSRAEAAQRKITELLARDAAKMIEAEKQALARGEWSGELRHATRGGGEIIVDSRWTLVRDEHRNPKSLLVINTDITEKRALETQLLRSQRMDSLGTLAGGIAHDLNNVLAPIMMGVDLIRIRKPDPSFTRTLNTIETSAKRGADLVKQILTFARGVDGDQQPVQIRPLLQEMEKLLSETFPKSISVSFELGEGIHPVIGDATQLHQVLLNLCVNARDAMSGGGRLSLHAANLDPAAPRPKYLEGTGETNYVLLQVSDTGTGIPPEIAEKIFEPFFTTKEVGKGTGLGLATVSSIIRKHRGFLDFKSEVGKGTKFFIYLPAAPEKAAGQNDSMANVIEDGGGKLVLVVDDEPLIRTGVEEMLLKLNFRVAIAADAQAAIGIAAEKRSELVLILMDRMMPGLDPLKAMHHLKSVVPGIPIICMSGLPPAADASPPPFDAYLPKPFTKERLIALIGEHLAAPAHLS